MSSNNQAFLDKIYQEVKEKDKDIKKQEDEIVKLKKELEKKNIEKSDPLFQKEIELRQNKKKYEIEEAEKENQLRQKQKDLEIKKKEKELKEETEKLKNTENSELLEKQKELETKKKLFEIKKIEKEMETLSKDEKNKELFEKEKNKLEKLKREMELKKTKKELKGPMSIFIPLFLTTLSIILTSVIIMANNDPDFKKKVTFNSDSLVIHSNILIILSIITIYTWKLWIKSNHPDFLKNIDFIDKLLLGTIPLIIIVNILFQFKGSITIPESLHSIQDVNAAKYLSIPIIYGIYYGLYRAKIITDKKMLIIMCIITALFLLIMLNFGYIKELNNTYLIDSPESLNYVIPFIMFSIFGTLHYKNKISLFSSVTGWLLSTITILIILNMKRINSVLTPNDANNSNNSNSDITYDDSQINRTYQKYYFDVLYDEKINYIPIIITIVIYLIIILIGQLKFFK